MSKSSKIFGIVAIVLIIVVCVGISASTVIGFKDVTTWDGVSLKSHTEGAIYDYTYYKSKVTSKKAMILIPGLMASSFYNPETEKEMWGYAGFGNILSDLAFKKTPEEKDEFFDFVVSTISADENNVPFFRQRVANMNDREKFASFDGMKYIYEIIQPLYGDRYDIVVWQYDWRQHNAGSAAELQKFIDYNGWEELMFFTHSMGGVVTANYLALSESNREKTKLFMPFGCPFFGSMDAITNLFTEANPSGLMNMLFQAINNMFNKNFALSDAARTLASVYELLPMAANDKAWYYDESSSHYSGVASTVQLNGKYLTADELTDFIKSFDWTKRKDGSFTPVVNNLNAYRDNLWVDNGKGEKVFVTELVPTEYIVGVDVSTTVSVTLNDNGQILSKVKSMLGDGTVPAYSASAGNSLDDPNVHLVHGIEHGPLANDTAPDTWDKTGLQYLAGILEKYIKD